MNQGYEQYSEPYGRSEYAQIEEYPEIGLLNIFPNRLRDKIVDAILEEDYERTTDIWYEDEVTGSVWVKRYNMHWNLNETASYIWLQLGEKTTQDIVSGASEEFPDINADLIKLHFAEFLVLASANGIVELGA